MLDPTWGQYKQTRSSKPQRRQDLQQQQHHPQQHHLQQHQLQQHQPQQHPLQQHQLQQHHQQHPLRQTQHIQQYIPHPLQHHQQYQQQPPRAVQHAGHPILFPPWQHHPDVQYSTLEFAGEPRKRARTGSGKKRPLRSSQQAEIEVHRFADCDQPSGHVHQGSFSAMSPSLETGYSFGPTCTPSSVPGQWSQDQCADTRENYADLCFSQSKMNGSQPCLASEPKAPPRFRRNGSQPCLRSVDQSFRRQLSTASATQIDPTSSITQSQVNGVNRSSRHLPKSASFSPPNGDTQTALDVVRTKRAKQLFAEKSISKFPTRLTKAATDPPVCQILVEQTQVPTPHQSIPSSPQASPNQMAHPAHPEMLSPETVLPPPPSPPCTCGKVLGDMGPPPAVEEWDNQSIDSHFTAESKGTLESRRSQGYASMNSTSTYLIDATGTDPVLVPAEMDPRASFIDSYQPCDPGPGPMFGYPMQNSVDSAMMRDHMPHHSDRIPLCDHPGLSDRTSLFGHNNLANNPQIPSHPGQMRLRDPSGIGGQYCDHQVDSCQCFIDKSILKKTTFPRQTNGNCSNGNVKTFSIDSDDHERGVTFRVGKFIGQVTIESVKFRRQHWLFLLICLLIFVIVLSIYLPMVSRADNLEDPEYRLMMINQMFKEVPLIDGHNDLPWNIRQFIHNKLKTVNFSSDLTQVSPWATSKWSHTDLPRIIKGRLGAQLWVAYAPCGSQHKDAVQITLEQIDLIKRLIEQYQQNLQFVTTAEGLVSSHKAGRVASVISVESGHSIGTSLAVLRMYYRLGARSLTLTHNCNNPWADSSLVDKEGKQPVHNGLTPFGKTVINEMNRLGMIVDLSHSSVQTAKDTLTVSEAPVIFSHSSAQSICNSTRNVPDHLLKLTAAKGGLVMINFFSYFITCSNLSSITDVIAHINHVRDVAGVESVGIGASYDGINAVPKGLEDVSKYVELFSALYASGKWTIQELKQLAGLNFLRVWREVEKVSKALKALSDTGGAQVER
eukprot:TRINITY_DN17031_c0_g1_i2.p1 TRINITY_DN17031_c0_g1~~TRINITY_DN17031_c0_g1_i2.p1  ORF type:complete len:1005 (+),score=154.48 TRINITY_DN17031_c0_g1_i2:450-3464(+)